MNEQKQMVIRAVKPITLYCKAGGTEHQITVDKAYVFGPNEAYALCTVHHEFIPVTLYQFPPLRFDFRKGDKPG